jgi:hypothetical protein
MDAGSAAMTLLIPSDKPLRHPASSDHGRGRIAMIGPELPYPSTQNRLMQIWIPRGLGHAYSSCHCCSPVSKTPYLSIQKSGNRTGRKWCPQLGMVPAKPERALLSGQCRLSTKGGIWSALLSRPTAIDNQFGASNKGGIVTGQIKNASCNIARLSQPS